MNHIEELTSAVAQLRHAYKQLAANSVMLQGKFAQGLIAPQIEKIENVISSLQEDSRPPAQMSDPLYDSRNPNHGRSGGLAVPAQLKPDTPTQDVTALADRIEAAYRVEIHDAEGWFCSALRIEEQQNVVAALRAALQTPDADDFKLTYVKRWRAIVKLPAKYAGEIVEALRSTHSASADRAHNAARDNLREAWAALAMIRETVETLAPSGFVTAAEHLEGPTFMHEADTLVKGIMALASAGPPDLTQEILAADKAEPEASFNNAKDMLAYLNDDSAK